MEPSPWIAVLINVLFVVGLALAGAYAFKRQYAQSVMQIHEKIINALREQNDAQSKQMTSLQEKVNWLEDTLATIRIALKRRGLVIRINGDYVTLVDAGMPKETVVKINKATARTLAGREDEPPAHGGKEEEPAEQPPSEP